MVLKFGTRIFPKINKSAVVKITISGTWQQAKIYVRNVEATNVDSTLYVLAQAGNDLDGWFCIKKDEFLTHAIREEKKHFQKQLQTARMVSEHHTITISELCDILATANLEDIPNIRHSLSGFELAFFLQLLRKNKIWCSKVIISSCPTSAA